MYESEFEWCDEIDFDFSDMSYIDITDDEIKKDEIYRQLEKFNIEDVESYIRFKKLERIKNK